MICNPEGQVSTGYLCSCFQTTLKYLLYLCGTRGGHSPSLFVCVKVRRKDFQFFSLHLVYEAGSFFVIPGHLIQMPHKWTLLSVSLILWWDLLGLGFTNNTFGFCNTAFRV